MQQYNINYQSKTASKTILIIDDDRINRKILGKIFSDTYQIKEAENGNVGMAQILSNRGQFCAILLDVIMPEMDGIEVLRHLKSMKMLDETPVFLITAEQQVDVVKEAYELGVMDVLTKPVTPYVVRRRVESVIELYAARKYLHNVVESQQAELMMQAEKIQQLNQGMIEALATAIEFRNEESGGHVNRIYTITKYMLENTEFGEGLSEDEIHNIALASIMHDVGKITIPDAILSKPGKLTTDEYEVMKTHTTRGVALLESISQLKESEIYEYACDIARHHHERWNGKGYPDHLKGDEISPWSQVVSLADVYDALSCKRVYKAAFSRNKVLEMIWAGQCGVFNPSLLDSFFSVEEHLNEMYRHLAEVELA